MSEEKGQREGPEEGEAALPKATRVLELNAKHPVFQKLVDAQSAGDADKVRLYAGLLYDQALLVQGVPVDDPIAFARSICELM